MNPNPPIKPPTAVAAAAMPEDELEVALVAAVAAMDVLSSRWVAIAPVVFGAGFSPSKPSKFVHVAVKAEWFWHADPSVELLPATKLTAAHCRSRH